MKMKMTMEMERKQLLKKLLIERYGELATRPEGDIPDDDDN